MTACKFKEGDMVYAPFHGYGVITKIYKDGCVYPIIVEWYPDKPFMETTSSFTEDGYLFVGATDNNPQIIVVKRRHNHRKLLNRFRAFLKGE